MRRLLACVVLAACCSSAFAVSVKDYVKQRDSSDLTQFRQTSIYITGVASGYIWANSQIAQAHGRLLFCQPPPVRADLDYRQIIDDEIGEPYVTPDYPVELLLLAGLARKFPCPD